MTLPFPHVWARFSNGVCGAKLHIVYDCDAERSIEAAVTPARLTGITAAQALPIATAATHIPQDQRQLCFAAFQS